MMEQQHTYKLIDGEFDPFAARSILCTLINNKINFHSIESFGITIRSSGDTSFHDNRIKELAQTNVDIKKVIAYAAENKLRLKIDGTIDIKFIDESDKS